MLRPGAQAVKPLEFFYDPLDMTTCVSADATVGELNSKAAADRLYFPLFLDEQMTIGKLVLGYRYTSRSFRFGPLCDNVLGFNFVLPNGKTVKVGAQVVKNVTGFDFARFLTNSGYRFGDVERVVLRLRSMAEKFCFRQVTGELRQLNDFRKLFLASPKPPPMATGAHGGPVRHTRVSHHSTWSQLLDSFDFTIDSDDSVLHISFSCEDHHVKLFDEAIEAVARETGCQAGQAEALPIPSTEPYARVKTLMSRTLDQASSLVGRFGGRACGFVGNAFFHYDPEPERSGDPELIQTLQNLHGELSALGGHVRCQKLTYPEDTPETRWERMLKEKWEALQ